MERWRQNVDDGGCDGMPVRCNVVFCLLLLFCYVLYFMFFLGGGEDLLEDFIDDVRAVGDEQRQMQRCRK